MGMAIRLHRAGILHGDIEPQNVVRGSDGKLLFVDFSESSRHACPVTVSIFENFVC